MANCVVSEDNGAPLKPVMSLAVIPGEPSIMTWLMPAWVPLRLKVQV